MTSSASASRTSTSSSHGMPSQQDQQGQPLSTDKPAHEPRMSQLQDDQPTVDSHIKVNERRIESPLEPVAQLRTALTAGEISQEIAATGNESKVTLSNKTGCDQSKQEKRRLFQELNIATRQRPLSTQTAIHKTPMPSTPRLNALNYGRVPFLDLHFNRMLTPILQPQDGKPIEKELDLNAPRKPAESGLGEKHEPGKGESQSAVSTSR